MISRSVVIEIIYLSIAFFVTLVQLEKRKMKVGLIRNVLTYSILLQIATIQKINGDPPQAKLTLLAYTRESTENINIPVTRDDFYMSDNIDLKKPLVFIIPGEALNTGNLKERLAKAYLKRRDVIVFTIAYYIGFALDKELISFIKFLINVNNVKASRIHLIGDKLHAHVCGLVAKQIPNLGRITALDPSYVDTAYPRSTFLSGSDATYVDVIHTDEIYGTKEALGQVDLYVNGGAQQPGCEGSDKTMDRGTGGDCSHMRAAIYFITSMENRDCVFIAASTHDEAVRALSTGFNPAKHTVLGLDTFEYKARGSLFIITNRLPHFCMAGENPKPEPDFWSIWNIFWDFYSG